MQKVKFIYNPSSGESEISSYLDQIIELYQKKNLSIVPYRLDFKGNAYDIVYDLNPQDYNHILIAGGDGSVNYVVNLIKRHNLDIPVAVIPAGTANDFAALLGSTSIDPLKNCKRILDGEIRTIDLGVANGEYFVNVFSCGLFTDVSQKTPTILKNTFGKIAYYVSGLGELTRFRKMQIDITSDCGSYEGGSIIFFVFNGRTAGKFKIAYRSEPDDGMLDVLILKGDNPVETLQTLFRYIGNIVNRKDYPSGVVHFKCSRLTARCLTPETTDIDGQPGPSFPIEIRCERSALRVIQQIGKKKR